MSEPVRDLDEVFAALQQSSFRRRFALRGKDLRYLHERGIETILKHAREMIAKRLAPANIPNDGKQTPMRGHPVFIAQHATATCCRGCLAKWHHIPKGHELTDDEQAYVVSAIEKWLKSQSPPPPSPHPPERGLFD